MTVHDRQGTTCDPLEHEHLVDEMLDRIIGGDGWTRFRRATV